MNIFSKNIFLAIVVAVCVVAIIVLHIKVISVRSDIALRQQQINTAAEQAQQNVQLKKKLSAAQDELASLQHMTPIRDNLPEVVNTITQSAISSGVVAQVPQVSQNTDQTVSSNDPLNDIRIHISASGSPASLMIFLYRIEQLPYILHIASWDMDTTHQVSLNVVAPAPTGQPVPSPALATSLEADIIMEILK